MNIWDSLNGNKTALGGALLTLGLALGWFTQEDVEVVKGLVPTVVAAGGALVQLVGLGHKIWKRVRG